MYPIWRPPPFQNLLLTSQLYSMIIFSYKKKMVAKTKPQNLENLPSYAHFLKIANFGLKYPIHEKW